MFLIAGITRPAIIRRSPPDPACFSRVRIVCAQIAFAKSRVPADLPGHGGSMQDPFTEANTFIRGRALPPASERVALHDDHRRRLEALTRLGEAAAQCGLRPDSDCDLVLLAEDEVSLLEGTEGPWSALGSAIRGLRGHLPRLRLEDFGFPADAESPLEEANPRLVRIGGGVEAWAFLAPDDGSVYKFYLPREQKSIGSEFAFGPGDETAWSADAELGDYRALFEKLLLINALGMPTEVTAITVEGIVVAKQVFGDPLPQEQNMSGSLPPDLIEIPSRFLRANRDHPRLYFSDGAPYLVADLHARNFVATAGGEYRLIDLVAAHWPAPDESNEPVIADWLSRVAADPCASLLPPVPDSEL